MTVGIKERMAPREVNPAEESWPSLSSVVILSISVKQE